MARVGENGVNQPGDFRGISGARDSDRTHAPHGPTNETGADLSVSTSNLRDDALGNGEASDRLRNKQGGRAPTNGVRRVVEMVLGDWAMGDEERSRRAFLGAVRGSHDADIDAADKTGRGKQSAEADWFPRTCREATRVDLSGGRVHKRICPVRNGGPGPTEPYDDNRGMRMLRREG